MTRTIAALSLCAVILASATPANAYKVGLGSSGRLLRHQVHQAPPVETWHYDPYKGGINCDHDCDWFGNGRPVTEDAFNDNLAACPPHWIGRTIHIKGLGRYFCHEGGGAIDCLYSKPARQYVCRVDILARAPVCDGCLWHNWTLEGDAES